MEVPRKLLRVLRDEDNFLVLTTIFVGLLAGVGAVALQTSLQLIGRLTIGSGDNGPLHLLRVFLAPAAGALLAGPLIARFAPEAKGHGVPEVMAAVAINGGRIRGRVALVKIIASALTIGTGGSAGREGPIVQIGATFGSQIGRILKMTEQRVQLLVACGAAAGIAAVFNAPLAGMFFSIEVILQRLTTRGLASVVLSSVTASVMWRAAFGNQPVLKVPLFGLDSPLEMVFYALLGVLAAGVGIVFVRTLYGVEDWFERNKVIPDDFKPLIGALALGSLGIASVLTIREPLIYGTGLPAINLALAGQVGWATMFAMVLAKIVATSATLGSGGSGGVFAPSLFMGAMLGGGLGSLLQRFFPTIAIHPGAYAMVGMAAVFAGVAQAPITAVLILFEMTNDYAIIVPLMLACFVSSWNYARLQGDSIYAMKLRRRGIDLSGGRERHLLERTQAISALRGDFAVLCLPATTDQAIEMASAVGRDFLTVKHPNGELAGIVPASKLSELRAERAASSGTSPSSSSLPTAIGSGSLGPPTSRDRRTSAIPGDCVHDLPPLQDVIDANPPVVFSTDSLDIALQKMAPRGLYCLPLVESEQSHQLLGIVTRESILACYAELLNQRR